MTSFVFKKFQAVSLALLMTLSGVPAVAQVDLWGCDRPKGTVGQRPGSDRPILWRDWSVLNDLPGIGESFSLGLPSPRSGRDGILFGSAPYGPYSSRRELGVERQPRPRAPVRGVWDR